MTLRRFGCRPISLWAKGVKKRGRNRFVILQHAGLLDKDGLLPSLFTQSI